MAHTDAVTESESAKSIQDTVDFLYGFQQNTKPVYFKNSPKKESCPAIPPNLGKVSHLCVRDFTRLSDTLLSFLPCSRLHTSISGVL